MNTLDYAIKELNRYMKRIIKNEVHVIKVLVDSSFSPAQEKNLGIMDDRISIDIEKGKGIILANHPRSALIGVYTFLESIGCRFFTPDPLDEHIVNLKMEEITCKKTLIPTNRHRAICIEGALSIDHALAMIRWAPKVGFNGYFIQFQTPHEFFERYYEHRRNPLMEVEKHSLKTSRQFHSLMLDAIKETGLIHHAVGHGWTVEALGLDAKGWQKEDIGILSDEKKDWIAEISGERKFFKGIPLDTQLCYSKKDVRNSMAKKVVDHSLAHPSIDILHVWLADNFNNFCECEICKQKKPVEYYVMILNEIDALLNKKKHPVKIVFSVYFEMRWVPEENYIKNPDRFILMFAPITRSFTAGYPIEPTKKTFLKPTPFILNKNIYSAKIEENLSYLNAWKKVFQGDSFLFDYHYMWDVFKDMTTFKLARVLHNDVKALKNIGLNGIVSCQVQRNFAPSPFHMAVLAKTLIDPSIDHEALKLDVFEHMYQDDAPHFLAMLESIEKDWAHDYMRTERPMIDELTVQRFKSVASLCEQHLKTLEGMIQTKMTKQRLWYHHYFNILNQTSILMAEKAAGKSEETLKQKLLELRKLIFSKEKNFSLYYDAYYMDFVISEITTQKW
jgi:hypothetical protein